MAQRPQVAIADESLTVEPGRRVATRVKVRNTGRQVAHYRISCVEGCVPAAWASIPSAEVKLNPGADTDVVVQFEPPLDTRTQAGTFPYGIRVQPGPDDGQLQMVSEADLTVGAITAIEVRLSPKASAGRFNGKHRVLLDNKGTEDLQVRLSAFDDDEAVSAAIVPQSVNLPAGGAGEALLRVRARTPKVLGKPKAHPFHVAYRRRAGNRPAVAGPTDGGEVEATVDGSYLQKPVVAKWMLLVALLGAGLVAFLASRAMQTEPAEPGPPPLAPAKLLGGPKPGNIVELSWETGSDVETVLLRRIECATKADPVPEVLDADLPSVDVSGSPRFRGPVGPFDVVGEAICLQARSVAADESVSVWSPEVPEVVLTDDAPPAPEGLDVVAGDEPGSADVSWEPVEDDGDVRYDLYVDGRSQDPNGIIATEQTVVGLGPGEHQVVVQTVLADGTRSALSDEVAVTIPGPADGSGSGPGPGGPGSEPGSGSGSTVPPLPIPAGAFVVILPSGASGPPQHEFALEIATEDRFFPGAGLQTVGEDIALPGLGLEDGQVVVLQDGFASVEEIAPRCAAYEAHVQELRDANRIGPLSGVSVTCRPISPRGG